MPLAYLIPNNTPPKPTHIEHLSIHSSNPERHFGEGEGEKGGG